MATFPLIISFYTEKTLYQFEVQNLIASCQHWNLEYCIEGIPSFGSWELNCGYKPFFILQKLLHFKKPLLWIDADGVIVNQPEDIDAFSADLSVRINEDCPTGHLSKVISSTVFINNTEQGALLVRLWAEECYRNLNNIEREYEYWDQAGLRDAIFSNKHHAKVAPLPHAYAKIFDQKGGYAPIIEHFQASRRYKKLINNSD